jgi:hypothetical protein
VPEQALNRVDIDAGLEQVRRKGVTEPVDATRFGDPRAQLRRVVGALKRTGIHRLPGLLRRKQPRARARPCPVPAKPFEQARRPYRVSVLAALALLHAYRHSCRINVGDPKVQDFVESQARCVGREEHRAMLRIRRVHDHLLDFFAAQNRGELLPLARRRNGEGRAVAFQRRVKEEPQPVRHHIAGAPGPLPLAQQVDQIRLHLLV